MAGIEQGLDVAHSLLMFGLEDCAVFPCDLFRKKERSILIRTSVEGRLCFRTGTRELPVRGTFACRGATVIRAHGIFRTILHN